MIVFGGNGNTGGRYNPASNSWTAVRTTNAPGARSSHVAVWTGSEMIVWGGGGDFASYFNTGGRYNPATDSWVATTNSNAPGPRVDHTAMWTGTEMIVWGGWLQSRFFECAVEYRREIQSGDEHMDCHQHEQCTGGAQVAQRHVDGERDDRLGRRGDHWQSSQHRRPV